MKKPEVKSGLINQSRPINTKKITTDDLKKQIARMKERDSELVTGVFKNLENPATNGNNGAVVFTYRYYPNDDIEMYELHDGERYALPRGVARHLNNNCFYREYNHHNGQRGAQGMRVGAADGRLRTDSVQESKKVHRYAFHSLEYMDDDLEMYPTDLVEVTLSP